MRIRSSKAGRGRQKKHRAAAATRCGNYFVDKVEVPIKPEAREPEPEPEPPVLREQGQVPERELQVREPELQEPVPEREFRAQVPELRLREPEQTQELGSEQEEPVCRHEASDRCKGASARSTGASVHSMAVLVRSTEASARSMAVLARSTGEEVPDGIGTAEEAHSMGSRETDTRRNRDDAVRGGAYRGDHRHACDAS